MNTEPKWNLALQRINDVTYQIIMPDNEGNLGDIPEKGYVVKWPINPHFTGVNCIAIILEGTDKFRNCNFITE